MCPVFDIRNKRILTLQAFIRVHQIEATRTLNTSVTDFGSDESAIHTPARARFLRDSVARGFRDGRITWGMSWLALHDPRPDYVALRKLVADYHHRYGDDVTFIPGGFFPPMYNARAQVNRDIKDALATLRNMMGGDFKPKSIIAGYLAADSLRYLAEVEDIHVAQATIWSQYGIDNGDGDGSISYPYYPSREHYCKPAQGTGDFIDCVNLDGWTCDFLCARRYGFEGGFNSRLGVGPIESFGRFGLEKGLEAIMATMACHYDRCINDNGFGWCTVLWEVALMEEFMRKGFPECLEVWLSAVRDRWPDAVMPTLGEFGEAYRSAFPNNDKLGYRFTQRGTGFPGSEPAMEIRWFMNRDFRLAILRDWEKNEPGLVIDFTRYDITAHEPPDATEGNPSRNWSLINRINQKCRRPEDAPVPLSALTAEERALIARHYPELF
ncbi:MAG: DUF3863 domain-containing protein [Kiritimatiellaeota bacterium]|nr:DUF3863 domain-containing protein [Kiritimatiellota bacterium]